MKTAIVRGFALVLALALAATTSAAQGGEPTVTARLDSGVIRLGDQTSIVIVAENADRGRVSDPQAVDGLVFGSAGRPQLEESTSWVNGRVSRRVRMTWVIAVKPVREGRFTIPPFTVEVGGREYKTAPQELTAVADLRGEELGYFEIKTSGKRIVEGQPFSVELLFGWDADIQNRINHANLSLPWWGQLPGAIELDAQRSSLGGRAVTLALNGSDRVEAELLDPQMVRGKPFLVLRVRQSFLAVRSGEISFPTSTLEFSRVIESGSFLSTSTRKAESYFVQAPAFTIESMPLPEAGRPFDFTGAVGTIAAWADADTRDVMAGESIKLTVEWSGTGNLEFFELPDPSRMEAFRGFRVYGASTVDKGSDFRRAVFDLAPLSADVSAIPPLPLAVFDPEQGSYVEVATRSIPIRVTPLPEASPLADLEAAHERRGDVADIDATPLASDAARGVPGAADETGAGTSPRRRGEGARALVLPAGLALGLTAVWLVARRIARRRGDPSAPLERRRRAARKRLAKALAAARTPGEELDALHAFLAARTREPDTAWVGRDVREWLGGGPALGETQLEPGDGQAVLGDEPSTLGGKQTKLAGQEAAELDQLVRGLERATWSRTNGEAARVGSDAILGVADRLLRRGF